MSTEGTTKAVQEHLFNFAITRTILKEFGEFNYVLNNSLGKSELQIHT